MVTKESDYLIYMAEKQLKRLDQSLHNYEQNIEVEDNLLSSSVYDYTQSNLNEDNSSSYNNVFDFEPNFDINNNEYPNNYQYKDHSNCHNVKWNCDNMSNSNTISTNNVRDWRKGLCLANKVYGPYSRSKYSNSPPPMCKTKSPADIGCRKERVSTFWEYDNHKRIVKPLNTSAIHKDCSRHCSKNSKYSRAEIRRYIKEKQKNAKANNYNGLNNDTGRGDCKKSNCRTIYNSDIRHSRSAVHINGTRSIGGSTQHLLDDYGNRRSSAPRISEARISSPVHCSLAWTDTAKKQRRSSPTSKHKSKSTVFDELQAKGVLDYKEEKPDMMSSYSKLRTGPCSTVDSGIETGEWYRTNSPDIQKDSKLAKSATQSSLREKMIVLDKLNRQAATNPKSKSKYYEMLKEIYEERITAYDASSENDFEFEKFDKISSPSTLSPCNEKDTGDKSYKTGSPTNENKVTKFVSNPTTSINTNTASTTNDGNNTKMSNNKADSTNIKSKKQQAPLTKSSTSPLNKTRKTKIKIDQNKPRYIEPNTKSNFPRDDQQFIETSSLAKELKKALLEAQLQLNLTNEDSVDFLSDKITKAVQRFLESRSHIEKSYPSIYKNPHSPTASYKIPHNTMEEKYFVNQSKELRKEQLSTECEATSIEMESKAHLIPVAITIDDASLDEINEMKIDDNHSIDIENVDFKQNDDELVFQKIEKNRDKLATRKQNSKELLQLTKEYKNELDKIRILEQRVYQNTNPSEPYQLSSSHQTTGLPNSDIEVHSINSLPQDSNAELESPMQSEKLGNFTNYSRNIIPPDGVDEIASQHKELISPTVNSYLTSIVLQSRINNDTDSQLIKNEIILGGDLSIPIQSSISNPPETDKLLKTTTIPMKPPIKLDNHKFNRANSNVLNNEDTDDLTTQSISLDITTSLSDQSEMEARILALRVEMEKKKQIVTLLKKRSKELKREKIKHKELVLQKQIEIYNDHIEKLQTNITEWENKTDDITINHDIQFKENGSQICSNDEGEDDLKSEDDDADSKTLTESLNDFEKEPDVTEIHSKDLLVEELDSICEVNKGICNAGNNVREESIDRILYNNKMVVDDSESVPEINFKMVVNDSESVPVVNTKKLVMDDLESIPTVNIKTILNDFQSEQVINTKKEVVDDSEAVPTVNIKMVVRDSEPIQIVNTELGSLSEVHKYKQLSFQQDSLEQDQIHIDDEDKEEMKEFETMLSERSSNKTISEEIISENIFQIGDCSKSANISDHETDSIQEDSLECNVGNRNESEKDEILEENIDVPTIRILHTSNSDMDNEEEHCEQFSTNVELVELMKNQPDYNEIGDREIDDNCLDQIYLKESADNKIFDQTSLDLLFDKNMPIAELENSDNTIDKSDNLGSNDLEYQYNDDESEDEIVIIDKKELNEDMCPNIELNQQVDNDDTDRWKQLVQCTFDEIEQEVEETSDCDELAKQTESLDYIVIPLAPPRNKRKQHLETQPILTVSEIVIDQFIEQLLHNLLIDETRFLKPLLVSRESITQYQEESFIIDSEESVTPKKFTAKMELNETSLDNDTSFWESDDIQVGLDDAWSSEGLVLYNDSVVIPTVPTINNEAFDPSNGMGACLNTNPVISNTDKQLLSERTQWLIPMKECFIYPLLEIATKHFFDEKLKCHNSSPKLISIDLALKLAHNSMPREFSHGVPVASETEILASRFDKTLQQPYIDKRIIFNFVYEVFCDLYMYENVATQKPWIHPSIMLKKKNFSIWKSHKPPQTFDLVRKIVIDQCKELLESKGVILGNSDKLAVLHQSGDYSNYHSSVPQTSNAQSKLIKWCIGKQKDLVDRILIEDMRKEENEWIYYDESEEEVKLQIGIDIFSMLMDDTVKWLMKLRQPNYSNNNNNNDISDTYDDFS